MKEYYVAGKRVLKKQFSIHVGRTPRCVVREQAQLVQEFIRIFFKHILKIGKQAGN